MNSKDEGLLFVLFLAFEIIFCFFIVKKKKKKKKLVKFWMHESFKFELSDLNTPIIPSHKCDVCGYLMVEAYECENGCTQICAKHEGEDNKCKDCGGKNFVHNQIVTQKIKQKYEIKCLHCFDLMPLSHFDQHLQSGCEQRGNKFQQQQNDIEIRNFDKKRKREDQLEPRVLDNQVFFFFFFFYYFFFNLIFFFFSFFFFENNKNVRMKNIRPIQLEYSLL